MAALAVEKVLPGDVLSDLVHADVLLHDVRNEDLGDVWNGKGVSISSLEISVSCSAMCVHPKKTQSFGQSTDAEHTSAADSGIPVVHGEDRGNGSIRSHISNISGKCLS